MNKYIIIGRKRDNIIRKLRYSKIARLIFIVWFIYLYNMGLDSIKLVVINIVTAGIGALVFTNIMYMPVRFLECKNIAFTSKLVFMIIETLALVTYFNRALGYSVESFLEFIITSLIISVFVALGIATVKNSWKCTTKSWNSIGDEEDCNSSDFDEMEGHDFEFFCAGVLEKNRFTNVEVTRGSGDHGVDILATSNGIKYAIQCKRYNGNVGNHAVQEAYTGKSLYGADIAVVMTNAWFTQQAKEEAARLSVKLWNRDVLEQML